MPELPEVEIQTRQLRRRLRGARIASIEIRDPKIKLPPRIAGQRIERIRRRGKFIIFDLSNGDCLAAHLRMTGWFEFVAPRKYRLALVTNRGSAYLEDTRRFATVEAMSREKLTSKLAKLGPDPLARDFDLAPIRNTSRAIKVALLDQRLIAGIGNIYASESLWRARIHPRRRAHRLSADELKRLRRGIILSLRKAIAYGPRIFAVQRFAVYEREGKSCRRCGAPIRRIVQAQRSTYFCPRCQRGAVQGFGQ